MHKIDPDLATQHWQTTASITSDRFDNQIDHDLMLFVYHRTEDMFREVMRELVKDIARISC